MHRNPQQLRTEPARPQVIIGFLTRRANTGHQHRQPLRSSLGRTSIDQSTEHLLGGRTTPYCGEFDQAGPGTGLAGRAIMADRKSRDPCLVADQNRVTELLGVNSTDFCSQIEPVINRVGGPSRREQNIRSIPVVPHFARPAMPILLSENAGRSRIYRRDQYAWGYRGR